MKPPCEIIVKFLLPMIRASIAKELVDHYGLTQQVAAEKLGITQSAVSRYIKDQRGKTSIFGDNSQIKQYIEDIVKNVTEGNENLIETIGSMCKICINLRTDKILCDLHRKHVPVDESCDYCMRILEKFHVPTTINKNKEK